MITGVFSAHAPFRRVALFVALVAGVVAQAAEPIRILTIGSSFAENATQFLPEIARSRGVTITIIKANIGGSDLARHAKHHVAWLKDRSDPEGKPYWDRADPAAKRHSLVEMLQSGTWDFVTLQQFSGDSDKPETYEPYSGQLIAAVREHAPSARIIVHQTWAYRVDHPLFFSSNPERQSAYERLRLARSRDKVQRPTPITQQAMFEGLRAAYDQLAARYGLLMVPVADAFQLASALPEWRFKHPDPEFDYERPARGTTPKQPGSLIGGWFWHTDRQTGQVSFALDAKHANVAGKYLGACVFFESLTGKNARDIAWRPDELSDSKAESLRLAAHESVAARKKAGTFDFARIPAKPANAAAGGR
jgi:hypothetical protein